MNGLASLRVCADHHAHLILSDKSFYKAPGLSSSVWAEIKALSEHIVFCEKPILTA